MSLNPESELIARCCKGDAGAWDELFELHYGDTARFVFQLGSDLTREDTEEICQETFLAVIHSIQSFRGGSRLQTWIFRIAANKARDYRERLKAAKRGGGEATISLQAENPETGLTVDPPATAPSPDAVLLATEDAVQVRRALDVLGDPCREIIELRYFGDLSYEEISAGLKLNLKTVSSRLSKCLDRLEEILVSMFSGKDSARFPVK